MSHEMEVRQMTTDALATKCAQETSLYFNGRNSDSTYCFELFRRAVFGRDDTAWTVLMVQYEPLVARWVGKWTSRHADFRLAGTEEEDFVAEAFARFWKYFTPEKFVKSQSLDAVLKYLKLCVHGAISDAWRKSRHSQFDQPLEDSAENKEAEPAEPEPTPEERLQKDEFWQLIRKKSKDDKEYLVLYASFSLALSPREILAEYPGEFRDIKEIYQHKANLLERLQRDTDIREFARW